VVSNDPEGIKATVAGELQEVEWLTLRVLCAEPGHGNKLLP
jgi:hypothetical protein